MLEKIPAGANAFSFYKSQKESDYTSACIADASGTLNVLLRDLAFSCENYNGELLFSDLCPVLIGGNICKKDLTPEKLYVIGYDVFWKRSDGVADHLGFQKADEGYYFGVIGVKFGPSLKMDSSLSLSLLTTQIPLPRASSTSCPEQGLDCVQKCDAVVTVKHGLVTVELDSNLGLPPGATLPLASGKPELRIVGGGGAFPQKNGHAII